jgi:hypothetical protein
MTTILPSSVLPAVLTMTPGARIERANAVVRSLILLGRTNCSALPRAGRNPTVGRKLQPGRTEMNSRRVTNSDEVVTATSESGETYAEVAHEAIFRRWDKLKNWIAEEREFLAWRSTLEVARRAWQATSETSKPDALLMGLALAQAQAWVVQRAEDLPKTDREFIDQSLRRDRAEREAKEVALKREQTVLARSRKFQRRAG